DVSTAVDNAWQSALIDAADDGNIARIKHKAPDRGQHAQRRTAVDRERSELRVGGGGEIAAAADARAARCPYQAERCREGSVNVLAAQATRIVRDDAPVQRRRAGTEDAVARVFECRVVRYRRAADVRVAAGCGVEDADTAAVVVGEVAVDRRVADGRRRIDVT